jgi:hypothetical protein
MGICTCEPPARLHIRPDGVHLPDGSPTNLAVVDEVWDLGIPSCSVCAVSITETYYCCIPCRAILCRACVSDDTVVVECDCLLDLGVTGVELAARLAASARAG